MEEMLLATCAWLPEGEPGGSVLVEAFESRGIAATWVRWDDTSVDWGSGLVAVRSTWDYETRVAEFLAWARSLPRVLNSAAVFEWNIDKSYLVQLPEWGVPAVPSVVAASLEEVRAAVADLGVAVVKPTIGAGGRGLVVLRAGKAAELVGRGPWVVQPLVDSVRTDGELSVYVIDGVPRTAAHKLPGGGEFRVHEEYGGRTRPCQLSEDLLALAANAIELTARELGERIDYGRVDLLRHQGEWLVSELELIEPGLYLDELPQNARAFADLAFDRLSA